MNTEQGKKNWVFCDGDLPPKTDSPLEAHEALMAVNLNNEDAEIKVTVLFEDKDPIENIIIKVPAKRVKCFRLDGPIGDINYKIPFGQYALSLCSDVPIFAVFGRLDTRQPNLAYYTVQGHSY